MSSRRRISQPRLFCCFLLAAASALVHVKADDDEKEPAKIKSNKKNPIPKRRTFDPPCKLWLAPSGLTDYDAGISKFGLFAGVDYAVNESIPFPELAIPLVDFVNGPFANQFTDTGEAGDEQVLKTKAMVDYLQKHLWEGSYVGPAQWEGDMGAVAVFVPGMGVLANHHATFSNVDWVHSSPQRRHHNAQESKASLGSMTPYGNVTLQATVPIPAGMELFANMGKDDKEDEPEKTEMGGDDDDDDDWESDENDEGVEIKESGAYDIYEQTTIRKDYQDADRLVEHLLEFFETKAPNLKGELQEDIIELVTSKLLKISKALHRAKSIRSLVPHSLAKLRQVRDVHGGSTWMFRNQDFIMKPRWLQRHGICVDTLLAQSSSSTTIPDAGRGLFASRSITKGDTVMVSPLLVIGKDELLTKLYGMRKKRFMHKRDGTDKGFNWIWQLDRKRNAQILLNYAYGHEETDLLFVPMAPLINYINHAPTTQGDDDESQLSANVIVEWSNYTGGMENSNLGWLGDAEAISSLEGQELVLQWVATRDIAVGQEVLMDYGPAWQRAWEEHVARIAAEEMAEEGGGEEQGQEEDDKKDPPFRSALDILKDYETEPHPINLRRDNNPYPANIATACAIAATGEAPASEEDKKPKGRNYVQWLGPVHLHQAKGPDFVMCDLTGRFPTNDTLLYNYTARAHIDGSVHLIQNIPHFAITLVHKSYSSELWIPGAFRHYIGLPDELVPQNWRNRRGVE